MWNEAALEISAYGTFDVWLQLRVEHGDDDFWIDDGPHRVIGDETVQLTVPWPNLSYKGALLAAPAVVTGFVRVATTSGAEMGVVEVEERLWFTDLPEQTLPVSELPALVAVPLDPDGALAGIAPEAVVAAGVTP